MVDKFRCAVDPNKDEAKEEKEKFSRLFVIYKTFLLTV